jgi:hypothetical protein
MLSSIMRSLNLYVSQQHMTGMAALRHIIATIAVPALENIAPLERRACVPSRVRETVGRMAPIADKRT